MTAPGFARQCFSRAALLTASGVRTLRPYQRIPVSFSMYLNVFDAKNVSECVKKLVFQEKASLSMILKIVLNVETVLEIVKQEL